MADAATAPVTLEELQAEVSRLKGVEKTLRADLDASAVDLRAANGEARDRRLEGKAHAQTIADLTADRDRFKGLAAVDTDGWKAKYETASGTLRGISHRKEFDALAGAAGVKDPSRVEALYQLSGYKPDKDDVDKPALTTLITTALARYGWLKSEAPAGAATTTTTGATGTTTTAAGAASTTTGTAAGAATASAGAPGSDRGQSVSSPSSTSPGRIPGRL
jgi:hypothetical protein